MPPTTMRMTPTVSEVDAVQVRVHCERQDRADGEAGRCSHPSPSQYLHPATRPSPTPYPSSHVPYP